jgi:hypothetical protein
VVKHWKQAAVATAVLAGLVAAIAANFWMPVPSGKLPGVALGSEEVLVVERTVALFAAWILVLVVVTQGLGGKLPTEISGRGVKYVEADKAQEALDKTQLALMKLDLETQALRRELSELQTVGKDGAEL